jgi:hypothetical protein
VPTASGGFDLPSAAIGAAGGTGVVITLLATAAVARRRPTIRARGAARI